MHLNFTCLSHNAAYSKSSQFWIFDIISDFSKEHLLLPIKLKVENRPTQELLAVYIKKELKLFAGKKTLSLPQNSIRLMHSMKQTHTYTHNFCAKNFVFIWLFRVVHFYFQLSFFFNF